MIPTTDPHISLFKRPHNPTRHPHPHTPTRHLPRHTTTRRQLKPFSFSSTLFYALILLAVFAFALASMLLQTSLTSLFRLHSFSSASSTHPHHPLSKFGTSLRFVPRLRFPPDPRSVNRSSSVRPPRLALILGNTKKNPESLMLFSVMKNLQQVGYVLKLYALNNGEARSMWEEFGGQWTTLNPERHHSFDWSLFEGVIADSLEATEVLTSLMQDPFCSVPLIWIIQEDILAKRLQHYHKMGWEHLISYWRRSFSRADAVVFPDYSLAMLYSPLDSGNFYVIPGSPVDAWSAESYVRTHSKVSLRENSGYGANDVVVLVVGSSIYFNEQSWDYAVAMHTIGPLLVNYAKTKDVNGSFKFVFLCGNSTDEDSTALEDIARRLKLAPGSLGHYGMDQDLNGVLLMADIVIYGPSQDEQAFPPLLIRAMSLGIPMVAPDISVISRYVIDGVHGMIFSKHNPEDLLRVFSLLVSSDGKCTKFAEAVGSTGKLLARNLLAFESITGYAKLMESVINFPSDASLPVPASQIQQDFWEWDSFNEMTEQTNSDVINVDKEGNSIEKFSIIHILEEEYNILFNISEDNTNAVVQDLVSTEDLVAAEEISRFEEFERREMDQIEERMEKDPGVWDEIYRNARKSEKLKFEANERDEGELERTGRLICIYEVYGGAGAWPFLHHGSLYRGLSLSTKARRLSSDDVNAVNRLPVLNNSRYRDLLCEMGGMFSIAYKVDDIHRRPWIGFQSWQATGRKVSLSTKAERILEETIQHQSKGDVMYFWTRFEMEDLLSGSNESASFWSMCDLLNGGHCRTTFQDAFRHMYGLPSNSEALPPMPADHGHWSALNSWVMPTSSFLEFIMFTRIFVDSLDAVHNNTSETTLCLLGFSEIEKKHCYCRVLDLLVNVWAYHSARRMVYIDPRSGMLEEQFPVDERKGLMWVKYFNFTLLKSMDEDLAEAADDGDLQREAWLWPLTGEVHWQGIYEREREQRYRVKMDKKRKLKEKLFERMKYGYRQKSLGG